MTWQRFEDMPKDGTPFIFRARSLATGALLEPMVGRYRGDVFECNEGTKWREFGYPPVMWADIPELP